MTAVHQISPNEPMRRSVPLYVTAVIVSLFIAALTPFVRADAGMDLLTGIGYGSVGQGPYVLIGTKLSQRSRDFGVGLHLSNVMVPNHGSNTVTLGLEGSWSRMQLPFYSMSLQGNAYLRQQEDEFAQNMSLRGRGSFGNLAGDVAVGFVGRSFASFPWDRDDLADVVSGDDPYYYLEGGVTAVVSPSIGLRWTQDVAWQRYAETDLSSMSFATGPSAYVGNGRLSLQGGVVIGPGGMTPLMKLSYRLDSNSNTESAGQLHVSVETTSLSGGGPVISGSYTLDADFWRVQSLVRLEQDNLRNPKIYFSIQPRL